MRSSTPRLVLAQVGYPKTTIEGIAARAGRCKDTIYRWWSSKAGMSCWRRSSISSAQAAEAADRSEVLGSARSTSSRTPAISRPTKLVLRATVDELQNPTFEIPSRALAAEGVVNEALGVEFVTSFISSSST